LNEIDGRCLIRIQSQIGSQYENPKQKGKKQQIIKWKNIRVIKRTENAKIKIKKVGRKSREVQAKKLFD